MKMGTAPIEAAPWREDFPSDSDETLGRRAAFMAIALLAVIWGYNWLVMKVALSYAPPVVFGTFRAGSAAAFPFALLAACGSSPRMPASP